MNSHAAVICILRQQVHVWLGVGKYCTHVRVHSQNEFNPASAFPPTDNLFQFERNRTDVSPPYGALYAFLPLSPRLV